MFGGAYMNGQPLTECRSHRKFSTSIRSSTEESRRA